MSRFLVRPKACHEKISDGPGAWLIPSKKMPSGRTTMYSPEGIFPLGITHSSRPAAKLNKKVFRPERTVCVQSRKRFFTPEQPIHPGLSRNFGRSGRISGLGYQKMTHDVLLCTVTRLFLLPKTIFASRPVSKRGRTVFRPELRHSPHFRTTAPCQGESLS